VTLNLTYAVHSRTAGFGRCRARCRLWRGQRYRHRPDLGRSAARGATIVYLTIWNEAGVTDRYKIGADGSRRFKVRYLWDGTDITSAIVGAPIARPPSSAMSADLTMKVGAGHRRRSSAARHHHQSVGDQRSDVVRRSPSAADPLGGSLWAR
jgi:hypothetical protein